MPNLILACKWFEALNILFMSSSTDVRKKIVSAMKEYHNFVANSKLLINAELNGIEWKISK
jgi:hypothetical protein